MKNILVIIVLTCFTFPAFSQPGSLDQYFGNKGIATTSFGSGIDEIQSIALQSDGKIVAAGYSFNGTNYDFALARFKTDGTLDSSFDTDGKLTTNLGNGNDYGYCVGIQADGKILVAGSGQNPSNTDFALVRYNSDGILDTSFSHDGIAMAPIGTSVDIAYSMAIQTNGKIVLVGDIIAATSSHDFGVARFNANGTLDNTFSGDGILTTDILKNLDEAHAVAVQSDGKIVVTGLAANGSHTVIAITRYSSTGILDNTFSSDGIQTASIKLNTSGSGIIIQGDGKILVSGYTDSGSYNDFALVRFNTNGTLDNTFSGDGKLSHTVGKNQDYAYGIDLMPDGRIVVSGTAYIGSQWGFAISRYKSDGTLDSSLNSNGMITTTLGTSMCKSYSIKMQSDGKILIGGYTGTGADENFTLARYITNCINFITLQPQNLKLAIANNAVFSVNTSTTTSTFQWQYKNGSIWQNLSNGGQYNGVTNDTLTLTGTKLSNDKLNLRCIIKSGACPDTSNIATLSVYDPAGISDNLKSYEFSIYPNPVSQTLTMEYTLNKEEILSIRLIDIHGKLLKVFIDNEKLFQGRYKIILDMPPNFDKGIYYINISTLKGQKNIRLVH